MHQRDFGVVVLFGGIFALVIWALWALNLPSESPEQATEVQDKKPFGLEEFIGDTLQTIPIVEQPLGVSSIDIHYTANGFEPADTRIQNGTTVRFVNDALTDVWVRTAGDRAYPGESACSNSALDSCRALKQGESWELVFNEEGFWAYWNESNHSKKGVIRVI